MRTITELLTLNWLTSSALPIGAFAWSQGLESAITQGAVATKQDFIQYLEVQLHYGMATFDLPLLARLITAVAQADLVQVKRLDAWVKAGRGTRELVAEEEQLGRALLRLLRNTERCPNWAQRLEVGYVAAFALAAFALTAGALEHKSVLVSFAQAWAQNLVMVACKTLPLGQTQGQQVLLTLMEQLEAVADTAQTLSDDEIGSALPGLMQLSTRHESQYSRLFRS